MIGYAATFTNVGSMPAFSIDDLIRTSRQMQAEKKRIDEGLRDSIRSTIERSDKSIAWWAAFFGIDFVEFLEVLHGSRIPDGRFWDRVAEAVKKHEAR